MREGWTFLCAWFSSLIRIRHRGCPTSGASIEMRVGYAAVHRVATVRGRCTLMNVDSRWSGRDATCISAWQLLATARGTYEGAFLTSLVYTASMIVAGDSCRFSTFSRVSCPLFSTDLDLTGRKACPPCWHSLFPLDSPAVSLPFML